MPPCCITECDCFEILKHIECNKCVISVDFHLRFIFSIFPFLITILKATGLISSGEQIIFQGWLHPLGWLRPYNGKIKLLNISVTSSQLRHRKTSQKFSILAPLNQNFWLRQWKKVIIIIISYSQLKVIYNCNWKNLRCNYNSNWTKNL